ncbi:hypothetical protein [Nonomuraea recticatena]|uniref:Uncharacterized protein n=1 Tax=Nonomuraea recticatena TaxID=46178 RepID=A0ABP6EDK6_9ACTN
MADEQHNGVVITFKEVYDELKALVSEVRKLTQELKESRDTDKDHEERIRVLETQKKDEDHERRLRILERWMYAIPVTAIISVVSVFFSTKGP